jgi:hypothetical protein
MRRGLVYLIILAGVVVVFAGAAEISLRSATCMACHRQEASFSRWMAGRLVAEKKGFSHELIACADCHISGSPEGTVMSRLRGLLHAVTYIVPQLDPRRGEVSGIFDRTRVPTENCQYCHLAAQFRKAVYLKDLPEGLKEIGLLMDHRKHVLAREDTCAKCHEQYKNEAAAADKGVNYAEVNHMSCDSCHTRSSHAYRSGRLLPLTEAEYAKAREEAWDRLSTNPRWMVAMPSEQTCKRCHNGKIHYKTRIFPADCREGKNLEECLKCHPLMTKEYFERYLRERDKPTSASNRDDSGEIDSSRIVLNERACTDIGHGSDSFQEH